MIKFRKLISHLAISSICASMFTISAFARVFPDVKDSNLEDAAEVLSALEIMVGDKDTGLFRPADPIKRSEAAKVGVALVAMSEAASNSAHISKYPDVAKDHWANGFINVATAQKLVVGDTSGTFRPDDQIKFSEAVTIIIRALGYEPQAMSRGGFPSGYIQTANSIGLTKGLSVNQDALISRKEVATLAYNALKINLMEQTSFGTNVSYEVTDKTLLKDKHGVELVTDKVAAVGASTLESESALSKGEIKIGSTVYSVGDTDVRNSLGHTVDAYIKKVQGAKRQTLIALVEADGKNNSVTVGAEEISKIENSLSGMALHYYTDKDHAKTIKASLTGDAQVIYNGKSASKDKFAMIDSGFIKLLDSDGDSKYDIVFVNETKNYVAYKIFPTTNKITDKYNMGTLILDFDDETKTVVLEKGGKKVTLKDLKEWDIITVTKSEDEKLIYAEVIRDSVKGKITEKDDTHIYIDGEKYKIASNYPSALTLGTEGTFYLDAEGKVSAFDGKSARSTNYAYLEGIELSQGLERVLKLKLFTKDGEMVTLSGADKLKINGRTGLSGAQAIEIIGRDKKLITFEKGTDGKITEINTYTEALSPDETKFTLNFTETDAVYRASSSKLVASDMTVTIDSSTLVLSIPSSGSEKDYAVKDKTFFLDSHLYDIMVFDMTEDYRAGAVIVTDAEEKADESSPIAVVDSITTIKDSDGETVHKLYAYSEGKKITLTSKDKLTFVKEGSTLLSKGDIIQYKNDTSGKTVKISLLFDSRDKTTEFKTDISDDLTVVYGKVTKMFSDSVNIKVSESSPENYDIENATVYVYDSGASKPKVSVGKASDIGLYENDSSRVFVRIYRGEVKEITVVK